MQRYRLVDKKKFAGFVLSVAVVAAMVYISVDFIRFPECYISTWRYQLQNEIEQGNEKMVDYYEKTYIANGRELFD